VRVRYTLHNADLGKRALRPAILGREKRVPGGSLARSPALTGTLGAVVAVAACGRIEFRLLDAAPDVPTDACKLGPWTTPPGPQPFGNVNTPADTEWGVEISSDGLRLLFSSNRVDPAQTGGRNYDIYLAQRASQSQAFSAPARLPISSPGNDDSDPSLTDDALELYFVTDLGAGPCFHVASRDSPGGAWSLPRRLDALCPVNSRPGGPYVSRDGLRLYYDLVVGGTSTVRMASRPDRSHDFASAGVSLGAPGLRYCALDASELTIYCENTLQGNAQLWQATRPSTDVGFPEGAPIPELGDGGQFEDGDPSLTGDGRLMVYASSRDAANGSSDLYLVERTCP
jgi:hypothetical protein